MLKIHSIRSATENLQVVSPETPPKSEVHRSYKMAKSYKSMGGHIGKNLSFAHYILQVKLIFSKIKLPIATTSAIK